MRRLGISLAILPLVASLAGLQETAPVAAGGPPAVTTGPASNTTPTSAVLSGQVNPQGLPTACHFEYGFDPSFGHDANCVPDSGSGTSDIAETATISGLVPGTGYAYRICAINLAGSTCGAIETFVTATLSPPLVVTLPATNISQDSATLNGTVNPEGNPTSCTWMYGAGSLSQSVTCAQTPGSGTGEITESLTVGGLAAGTTYSFQLCATNSIGSACGTPVSFTSQLPPDPPIYQSGLPPQSGVEGVMSLWAAGFFNDPDTAAKSTEYVATIQWGDGTSTLGVVVRIQSNNATFFLVQGNHPYSEEGLYFSTVTVTDIDNPNNSLNLTSTPMRVTDAPLGSLCVTLPPSATSFSGDVATLTDGNPLATPDDFTATINWGDGLTGPGVVSGPIGGPFVISGAHSYSTTGQMSISVAIHDAGGADTGVSCTELIFDIVAGGGAFVVGDNNSAIGNTVTIWAPDWSTLNSLSGGTAPASFKGFASSPTTPGCGTTWMARPGYSVMPPTTLPKYMAVIETDTSSKLGSVISGDAVHLDIVQTGDVSASGTSLTGIVVARIC